MTQQGINMKSLFTLALLFLSLPSFAQYIYPVAKKINQIETRFGTMIEDPYKWMENHGDPDLWSWIEEQKKFTADYLDANLTDYYVSRLIEVRALRVEQAKITNAALIDASSKSLIHNFTMQDDFLKTEKKEILKKWPAKPTFLKSQTHKTESATYKFQNQPVYGGDLRRLIISRKSDNQTVDILLVKFFTFIAWADDNSFYYVSDLDARIGGAKPALFKHTVSEIQSEDQILFTGKSATSDLTVHQIGDKFFIESDGTIGALQLATGRVTNRLEVTGGVVEVTQGSEVSAVILSFEKANYGEFYLLRLRDGKKTLLLGEQDFVLSWTKKLNENYTFIMGVKDSANVAAILSHDGSLKIIPGLEDGTIEYKGFLDGILKLGIDTYTNPLKVFSYNVNTSELKLLAEQILPFSIEAEKIYYTASNGQRASMWVMKKKGTTLTTKTPTIIYGYGGFRSPVTPYFGMYESLPWMEKGGALAVVTLPGSLDYGNSWYELAKVGGRIHAWDSFALAAKELFNRGWTSSEHIGMMGVSNGGTLVAGTLQRHSEIFKAAVPIVGVMDFLNFTLFTSGKYWTEDYGNPFAAEDFSSIYPLSPYHNLSRRNYPATMVMTAEFDDRVVPMHSYKYLARLQEYNTSHAPMLLYSKEWGAHGRGSGSTKESSRYVAALYSFFSQQLGLNTN
jgi:prolyl oligopeptidase